MSPSSSAPALSATFTRLLSLALLSTVHLVRLWPKADPPSSADPSCLPHGAWRLRRHASISSSKRRFLFSRRRSAASLAFLLFLRSLSRSLRRSVMVPSIVSTPSASPRRGLKGLGSSSLMAAPHTNIHRQYAPTSAEPKKAAAQNQACPLSSCLTQRVANTPLHRATMLAATSNPR